MAQWLRQSTAITAKIGPFIDDTDGKTAETGLTIAQADVRLSKNGGNIAQKNDATSCTHDELGIYGCPLNTTDTNTLGRLQLWVHESGALPAWHEFMVVPANVWDSMFGSDMLKVDVHSIDDDETAANNLESYCDGTTPIPANATQISDDATAADNLELITEIANIASLTVDASGHLECDVVEIEGADPTDTIRDAVVDDAMRIDASALNTLSGHDPGGILCADGTPLTAAETESEVNDALVALHLDHLLAVDYDPASKPGTATALLNELVESDAGISRFTENALEQAPSGTGASAAVIADAVWDETSTGHVDAGKAGQQLWTDLDAVLADTNELQTDDIPGAITGLNDPTAAAIRTEIDSNSTQLATIVADTNELQTDDVPGLISALNNLSAADVNTEMDTALSDIHLDHLLAVDYDPASKPGTATALLNELVESDGGISRYTANALEEAPTGGSAPTVGEIADAVWDEDVVAAHNTADTAGALLDDIGTPADFKATGFSTHSAADAADAVWDEAIADHLGAGSTGAALNGASAPSAATVADAVWDEANADHVSAGTTGKNLSDAGSGANAATIADAVWAEEMDTNAPADCDTAQEYMNVLIAAAAGKSAGTGDWSARDLGDTKTRLQGTLSAAGARSSVDILDGT